ncbi:hypothetical protein HZA85_00895 [Candidatus Uhrbacteria bacterium]|nr:hypothetical protein [Candidatus Uhrbacteria bacterium]
MSPRGLLCFVAAIVVVIGITVETERLLFRSSSVASQPALVQTPRLSQMACETAGGNWNACGSACRETPEAGCLQVCETYCECRRDEECPSGLTCGAFVDGVGVCQ